MFVNMVVKHIKMLMSVTIIDNKLKLNSSSFCPSFRCRYLSNKSIVMFFNKRDTVYTIISKNIFITIVYFEKLSNNEEK